MSPQLQPSFQGNAGKLLGFLMIALGLLFLFGQLFQINIGVWGWPFFIIVPGVVLFMLGFAGDSPADQPLLIVGSVVTAVGLLLFYQNLTGHWASWAYAWALAAPTAIGLGEMIYGARKGQPAAQRTGQQLATIGLVIFAVGAIFFEVVIGISGFGLGGWAWPALLIGLGLFLLLRNAMR
ncbi:MAG: hypothetical protein DYG89_53740 [Caldilinea sp. CFX5]|nr:hypothetical protein [Caldilinea sp. CFX5]